MVTEDDIKNALRTVKYPGYSRDIVSFGLVKHVAVNQGAVLVNIQLTTSHSETAQRIQTESERVLREMPGINNVRVQVGQAGQPGVQGQSAAGQSPWGAQARIPDVKRVVAVASG